MLAFDRCLAMVSYCWMEVDGGETASFIVKTYTSLTGAFQAKKKLFPQAEYTETIKKLSFVPF
jgi:hypothetical protein